MEYTLAQNAEHQKHREAQISRRDRLALAIVLASDVLQLGGSWLKLHWRSGDVLFLNLPSAAAIALIDYEHAFLPWEVSTGEVESTTSTDQASVLMEAH